jgi:hypothetical protein
VNSILRITGFLLPFFAAFLCAREALFYHWEKELFQEEKIYREMLEKELSYQKHYLEGVLTQDMRLMQNHARKNGYHLPGEIDWSVIETQGRFRWPEIWNVDKGKN